MLTFAGDEGVTALCVGLRTSAGLVMLDLSNNAITDKGADELVSALMAHPSLTQLQLCRNDLGDMAAVRLAEVRPAKDAGTGGQQLPWSMLVRQCLLMTGTAPLTCTAAAAVAALKHQAQQPWPCAQSYRQGRLSGTTCRHFSQLDSEAAADSAR